MGYLKGFDRMKALLNQLYLDELVEKESLVRFIDRHCTRNVNGRLIERLEQTEAVEQNNHRVWKNMKLNLKRQEIIEHVFGTIKRQWGYDHILLKDLKKNDGEFGLIFLVYNIRRIINILGPEELKKWLKSLFSLSLGRKRAKIGSGGFHFSSLFSFFSPQLTNASFRQAF